MWNHDNYKISNSGTDVAPYHIPYFLSDCSIAKWNHTTIMVNLVRQSTQILKASSKSRTFSSHKDALRSESFGI